MIRIILFVILLMLIAVVTEATTEDWMITFYCECKVCCGKEPTHPQYGVMASNRQVYVGAVACNILPLGCDLAIDDAVYTVEDRGCHELFDNKKHIDVYIPDHETARQLGVQYKSVTVFKEG